MGVRFFVFMGLKGLRTMTIPNSVCRILACVVLAILPGRPVGADVSGRARVVDGDSLVVSRQRVGMRPHRPGGRARRASFGAFALFVVAALFCVDGASAETWRGLTVAPEYRCSPYERKRDYRYSPSIEHDIVRSLGAVYGPYTGTCFGSATETDIEHIVATSEAHDSGLCARDRETRAQFATDLRNLTLASPGVNRHQKRDKDAAEWVPVRNRCWFAARVVEVRQAYGLTIDRREAQALERILVACESTEMEPQVCDRSTASGSGSSPLPAHGGHALELYDDNGNGRITCEEARLHGIAPVHRDHPAYRYMRDGDGDGVVCE